MSNLESSGLRPARRAAGWLLSLLDDWEAWHRKALGVEVVRGHHVRTRVLGPASMVFDLGAHRGEFSRHLREACGCRCVGLEANPELASTIPRQDGITVEARAIAGQAGEAWLLLEENPEAHRLELVAGPTAADRPRIRVATTTVAELAAAYDAERIDVLKLDVEGAELEVLEGLGALLGRIGQITVEFHDFLSGFTDGDRLAALRKRLRRAGFLELVASRPRGDHSDVLFLRAEELSTPERVHLFLLDRGVLPLRRLVERMRQAAYRRRSTARSPLR